MFSLKKFETPEEYAVFKDSCDYTMPNVTFTEQNDRVYYNRQIQVGDYLYDDGTICSCLIEGKKPLAICVIDADMIGDDYYRFMTMKSYVELKWDADSVHTDSSTWWDSPLEKIGGFPKLNQETGEYEGEICNGALLTFPNADQYDNRTVVINGWYYQAWDGELGNRGYVPPAFNADGTKNEIYWMDRLSNGKKNALTTFDGKERTDILAQHLDERDLQSIRFCKEFAPGFHDGEWYLPALGEWALVMWNYPLFKEKITTSIAGGRYSFMAIDSYQSSTEGSLPTEVAMNMSAAQEPEGKKYAGTYLTGRNKEDARWTVPFLKIKK